MPLIRCRHCGNDTFTIIGWADLDHCATCGRRLVEGPVELSAALAAKRQVTRSPAGVRVQLRAAPVTRRSHLEAWHSLARCRDLAKS